MIELTVGQYQDAITNALSPSQIEVLRVLYNFPNSTANAIDLAKALNYPHHVTASGNIGKIGTTIANYFGLKIEDYYYPYKLIGPYSPSEGSKRGNERGWEMKDNLRTALENLGEVDTTKITTDTKPKNQINYWAGGFGKQENPQKDNELLSDFIKNNYWAAIYWDKDDTRPEPVRIRKLFKQIKIGDKFLIKGFGGLHRLNVHYLGQVISIDAKKERLDFKKLNIEPSNGLAPIGDGAGNWWPALLKISRPDLIRKYFGDVVAGTISRERYRRRIRKAGKHINLTEQFRKGTGGYVTNPKHNAIQKQFVEDLKSRHKAKGDSVVFEENYVDIKLIQPDCITFYEVKPYDYAEDCIRSGIGQLLSYMCFDPSDMEKKMVIVGPYPPDEDDIVFIAYLKEALNIEFEYEHFEVI